MAVMKSIRDQLAPIHPEGYPFMGGFALATLVLWWLYEPLGWIVFVVDLLVRLFLPRSGAGDADPRRSRRLARPTGGSASSAPRRRRPISASAPCR